MKLLLSTLNSKYIHTNLAIRLLYGIHIHTKGLEWKEFSIRENIDTIASYCIDYEIVAFSCYIWNITQTLQVCEKIKAISPDTRILLGGPEVSYEWESVIKLPHVDYIIVGEGEVPFSTFMSDYPNVSHIPNVVSKKDGKISCVEKIEYFDLRAYENFIPYQLDKPEDLKNKVLYIETSRGCPYKCEFCLASMDNKVRHLSMLAIEQNLLYLMKHGQTIKFLDRTFNIKRDFTLHIFDFILKHHHAGNVFQFEITADILHPDIIKFIQEKIPKGLFRFEIGIQTVNQKANLEVQRKQNFEKTKNIILQLQNYVDIHADLIVGLALDYWGDIRYSFEQVFALFPQELQLGFLKFLKGTPLRDKQEKHGFVFDEKPPYQIIQSHYLSAEELEKIQVIENALEIYWNKKRTPLLLRYLSKRTSIFDLFLELGFLFLEKKEFHNYTLKDAFETMEKWLEQKYPEDYIAKELLAVDYYSHYKVRPQAMILPEIHISEKKKYIGTHKKAGNYIILDIHWDYKHFIDNHEIKPTHNRLILDYSQATSCKIEVVNTDILVE